MKYPKTRPEGEPIRCDFLDCFYGMGQAGSGKCPGTWWKKDCPEHRTEKEALKEWEEEDALRHKPTP